MPAALFALFVVVIAVTPLQHTVAQDTLRLPNYLGTICITPQTTCDVPAMPLYSTCYCSGGGTGQVLG